ncbi:MAG TPA: glycogen synthase [Flavobacteriales bacterium]|nr:glycogen synthase [Flavobacteriales bacterium]|tara:strand:+ start:592 stop:1419 length:828 start_codon:yes stop_codon:yes gene_type:complete
MEKARILYISQHIVPFLPATQMSSVSRNLPQAIHEKGREIRVFTPRFGKINERRHQLHEVIRLSGMNLLIDDTDHPLVIKVASIPTARMQVYFIDNDEYFKRKAVLHDADKNLFKDNDERTIFFARGVLETVKKLGWAPNIIHCHGWMTAAVPVYLKQLFASDPYFSTSKIITSIFNEGFEGSLDSRMADKMQQDGIQADSISCIETPTFDALNALSIQHSDGLIVGSEDLSPATKQAIESADVPTLSYHGEEGYVADINNFYDTILEGKAEAVS